MTPHEEAEHMTALEPPLNFASSSLTSAGRPHKGRRSYAPHRKAGHMTAPDHIASATSKNLACVDHPHMIFENSLYPIPILACPAENLQALLEEVTDKLYQASYRAYEPHESDGKLDRLAHARGFLLLGHVSPFEGRKFPSHDLFQNPT
jgi:hypothetical protein